SGGEPPRVDLATAPLLFKTLHAAIRAGLVRSCHDLSEGGLAVAAAEMAFAGGVGADLKRPADDGLSDAAWLFSESATRFLVEVTPEQSAAFELCFTGQALTFVGQTTKEPRLRVAGAGGEWVAWVPLAELKE